MTDNVVAVTQAFGSSAQGNFLFAAQGTYMDSTALAIVTPVVSGQLDPTGNLSASLLASDNFPSGSLFWYITCTVKNFPKIEASNVPVEYSLGSSQNLFSILQNIGYNFIEI